MIKESVEEILKGEFFEGKLRFGVETGKGLSIRELSLMVEGSEIGVG